MSRKRPYTTNQEKWSTILQKNLRIPMNQREYSWDDSRGVITKFLDDISEIFEEGEYVEKMGSIINLKTEGNNDIYDGQQRILTTILILEAISCFSDKLKPKIKNLLAVDTDIDDLTPEQETIRKMYEVSIIPKIYCVNSRDMRDLVQIFNNKVTPWIDFLNIDNLTHHDDLEQLDTYLSKLGHNISEKRDFIRHIVTNHEYEEPGKTKLNDSFITIYNYLALKKYDQSQLISLYKFIIEDIDIQYFECHDPKYVSKIFDWENNRGTSVESLDIIKNQILVNLTDDKKEEVYTEWELLKNETNKIYDNKKLKYGQRIFNIAIQVFHNKIERTPNYEELFKSIIKSDNTYKAVLKFFQIVKKINNHMDEIIKDKYGRLLNTSKRNCLTWEAYMYLILPISYITDTVDKNQIELLTKWYHRSIGFKTKTFNSLCYSNELIRITNEVLKDKNHNYSKELEKCLKKNKDNQLSDENYLKEMKEKTFKGTGTHILNFLETITNTDIHIVPLTYSLEHIYPQKNKTKLNDVSLMNNIGNLTLLEKKNSDNGHKGNSSLGSNSYVSKREHYKESNSRITRELAIKYEDFDEETIKIRNDELVKLLNKYTNY